MLPVTGYRWSWMRSQYGRRLWRWHWTHPCCCTWITQNQVLST